MRIKMEWKWERLDDNTSRVKVIGGWLVHRHRREDWGKSVAMSESMLFIPDRDHEWIIVAPIEEKIPAKSAGSDWESPKAKD